MFVIRWIGLEIQAMRVQFWNKSDGVENVYILPQTSWEFGFCVIYPTIHDFISKNANAHT